MKIKLSALINNIIMYMDCMQTSTKSFGMHKIEAYTIVHQVHIMYTEEQRTCMQQDLFQKDEASGDWAFLLKSALLEKSFS